jgi:RNA polymerase-binding transcription factor DksA
MPRANPGGASAASKRSKTAPTKQAAKKATTAKPAAGKAAARAAKPAARPSKAAVKPAAKAAARPAKTAAPKKKAPAKVAAKRPAKAAPKAAKSAPKKAAPPAAKAAKAPVKAAAKAVAPAAKPPVKAAPKKPVVLDKFQEAQKVSLLEERASYIVSADNLQAEADLLAADREPGDVQFDEESGEGDTLAVERERDLALSAQARAAVDEIDMALTRMLEGTYGLCVQCGNPIPRERLRAIPHASLCVTCKSMGLGRR